MKTIIALSGYKGSGKDTVAQMLQFYNFQRKAFADRLKEMASEEFGVSLASMNDPKEKESPLLEYPITAKDGFSKMIAESMFREFRTETGKQPTSVYINENGEVVGEVGRSAEQLYHTPRSILILKGSTSRSVDSNYWVKSVVKNMDSEGRYAISDVRYRSEIEALRKALPPTDKLITIRVNRLDESPSQDPSERDLDGYIFDYTIDNKGTLDELCEKVEKIMKKNDINSLTGYNYGL